MSEFIRDWADLANTQNKSKTHILTVDIEGGNGWLKAKNKKSYNHKKSFMGQIQHLDLYLSTHTFYGLHYENSSKTLRACGFDVELDNWDKQAN